MTAIARDPSALPQWLEDAVKGLVTAAYEAGRAARPVVEAAPVAAEPEFLDRREAARFLRCGLTKLDLLVREGKVPSVLHGGSRRFRRTDLLAYLAQLGGDQADPDPPRAAA